MKCERCKSYHGHFAEFRIVGEILDIAVCRECVGDAQTLGLRTRRIQALATLADNQVSLSQAQPTPM